MADSYCLIVILSPGPAHTGCSNMFVRMRACYDQTHMETYQEESRPAYVSRISVGGGPWHLHPNFPENENNLASRIYELDIAIHDYAPESWLCTVIPLEVLCSCCLMTHSARYRHHRNPTTSGKNTYVCRHWHFPSSIRSIIPPPRPPDKTAVSTMIIPSLR
ncbi:hypothetical protein BJ138DRAFT_433271 [Hygrophoropsis aurantiaca]|uniref:Uncharacterized protein n=1 Tax=Hygrophoropsis aurantiaca TaxID=72124 RepID=A0ACB8A3N4_9AGAM|nr:hypothetical protein BJ138DRAFT_433271 [Hygrophoropsis aurantiaca]